MELYKLPNEWNWTRLGDICEPVTQADPGKTPDRRIRYVDISGIDSGENAISSHKEYLSSEAPSRARKPIRTDDILFATVRTYLRNVAMVPPAYDGEIASTGFCVLRLREEADPRFVFRYLLTEEFIQRISSKQRGISYPAVTDRDVYAELIPLPPLPEQRRIVARLEALLAESRAAREALAQVPAQMQRFRQAVLARAFRGELVPQDPTDEPTGVLLERISAERRWQWEEKQRARGRIPELSGYREPEPPATIHLPGLPEGWVWVTVEMLASDEPFSLTDGPFGSNLKTADYTPSGVRVIRLQNIGMAEFKDHDRAFVTEEKGKSLQKHEAKAGDVVIAGLADPVGRACLIPEGLGRAIVKADCIRIRAEGRLAGSEYVMLALNTPEHLKRAVDVSHGVGRLRVNLNNIKRFAVPLAPLPEQHRIVGQVNALFAQAEAIETAATAARRRLERLDQAVLGRAFCGEL